MKVKYFVLFMALCIAASMGAGCTTQDTGKADTASQETESLENAPILVQIPAPSLQNNMVDEDSEQEIGIYLPPSYHVSEKEYPVVYFLPGFGDFNSTYINTFAKSMNELTAENEINELIIVTVCGINKLGGSFYSNSSISGNWEDFVTKDVINYMDKNYRTIKSADARGIAGHSMGGFGTVSLVMNTQGIFSCAYSMSPGLFDEKGLSASPLDLELIETKIAEYADMDEDAARTAYLDYIATLTWPKNFTFAYGSTFAGDPSGKAPYIKLPQKAADGTYQQDDVWDLYESGYGNLLEKIDLYKDNLMALKGFVIDYGTKDEFSWIPEGCEYFSQQLKAHEIPHDLVSYEGFHQSQVYGRIKDEVLPFFIKHLIEK